MLTADIVAAIIALGLASGIALWGIWLGYHERRKRLVLERALAKSAEEHAHRAAMDAFVEADGAIAEAEKRAAEGVRNGAESSSLAEYLRKRK